ncbi:MAG: hypothetical protein JJU09_07485 [Rhodobacteraceae bacterium]|nr:hypothetical protein [Paracoccaceae bacterium]
MIARLRIFFALMLALTLGLGSLMHALARHQAAGAQTMVICTGYGLVQITLDANGNPVEQSLPCPDCVLGAGALLVAMPAMTCPDTFSAWVAPVSGIVARSGAGYLWPPSRGPPLLV